MRQPVALSGLEAHVLVHVCVRVSGGVLMHEHMPCMYLILLV